MSNVLKEELKAKIKEVITSLEIEPIEQAIIDEACLTLRQAISKYKLDSNNSNDSNESNGEIDDIKQTYLNLYEDNKNNTKNKQQLPYVNREYYNHTFKPNDDIIVGFYVDDDEESYYATDVENFYKINLYTDLSFYKEVFVKSGSNSLNFGSLEIGEHILSYEAIDIYGRLSHRDYFEIRVKNDLEKVVYKVTDEELLKYKIDKTGNNYENTATGFNTIINELDEKYNYLIIPKGTYQIKYGEHIEMKDNLTLDLNESEFTLQGGQSGDSNIQMQIRQCYDSHIVNGTVEGDYETHDYAHSSNNSEWVHGVNLDGRSKYSSFENVTIKNITGYGSCSGMGADRNGDGYCWAVQYFNKETIGTDYKSSDFVDLSKFKIEGCNYFQLGRYLGYQGKPSDSWYYHLEMYNENKELVDTMIGYYYRRVYIPEEVRYIKMQSMGWLDSNVCLFAFKVPVNCEFIGVKHIMCRCVGCAPTATESLRVKECYFTSCGKNGAHCAFDSEDGWDMMHDFYMTNTVFENNYYNDWLTCGGHNFLLENNKYPGSIYIWTRCQNYTIRNNNVKNIHEGANKDTHHSRIYNNTINDTMNCSKVVVRYCIANRINGYADNCTVKSLSNDASQGYFTNCRIELGSDTSYIADIILDNCEITLAEGVTSRNISFNKKDGIRTIKNCRFTGDGKYFLANHNNFNSANFIDCIFESPVHIGAGVFEDNTNQILFKNCKMPFEGELIKTSPQAYSLGNINILFENCELIDIGGGTPDAYHKGLDFIWGFSKPTLGSVITFNNCTIDKTEGMLYAGYPKPENNFDLTITFNNTPITDNLLEIQEKYKEAIKVVKG